MSPRISVSLFSYGHANGPLVQPEREGKQPESLAYNIRYLPNPPRHLRATSTGLSKRLQQEFLQNDIVEAQLSKVQHEALETLKVKLDSFVSEPLLSSWPRSEGYSGGREEPPILDEHDPHFDMNLCLTVTVCCEEGRHRSVAFIEELARRLVEFKDGDGDSRAWCVDLSVTHRDINISTFEPDDSDLADKSRCTEIVNKRFKRKERRQKRAVRGVFADLEDE